ncbi:plant cysteine oxidase 2-like [Fagus crenata]
MIFWKLETYGLNYSSIGPIIDHYLLVVDADKPDLMFADEMEPKDVGLTPGMLYFWTQVALRTPKITYLHIHESEKFLEYGDLLPATIKCSSTSQSPRNDSFQ